MKHNCDKCSQEFSSKANLKYHQNNAKYCQNLECILFLCKNCYRTFHSLPEIHRHLSFCKKTGDEVEGEVEGEVGGEVEGEVPVNNIEKIYKNIEDEIAQIITVRKFSKLLKKIQTIRLNLLNYISITEYTKYVNNNHKKIQGEFLKKDTKLPKKIISKILSQFELRLIKYDKCYKQIEQSERDQLKNIILNKSDKIFNYTKFIRKLKNVYVYAFSIAKLIEFNLSNKTLIYYPNNDTNDMFSFYYLEKKDKDKNLWKQDCRLEKLTLDIQSELIPYCIDTYRKIYFNVFTDNVYREDMNIHSPLVEADGEQILYNLIFISNFDFFNNFLRKFISQNYLYNKIDTDTFNLLADDKLQKRGFSALQKEKNVFKNIKLLYDGISENTLKIFVENKLKNFDLNII